MGKMKKVKKKNGKNLTLPHGDLNPGFLNKTFPPKIWIISMELKVLKKSRLYSGKRYPFANVKNCCHLIWKTFCHLDILWQYGPTFSKGGHKEHAVYHVRERCFIVHPDASTPLAFVLIAGRGPNSKTISHQMA